MSHTVAVKIQMTDRAALIAAVERLGDARILTGNTHKLFSGERQGVGVQLKDWRYPVVLNLEAGEAYYDNYGGSWGAQEGLDHLAQLYGVEKARMEAMAQGRTVDEEELENGDIRLRVYSMAG